MDNPPSPQSLIMNQSIQQPIADAIRKSENILIALPKNPSPDATVSGLALSLALQKLKKNIDIVCDGYTPLPIYAFLPEYQSILHTLGSTKKFTIQVNMQKNKVTDFSYEIRDNFLNIYITPEQGAFTAEDVKIGSSAFTYDLIITINTPALNDLGSVYHKNQEFFSQTSIINIDQSNRNTNYGQINVIEQNTLPISEIVFDFLATLNAKLIDPDVATCLLTGILITTDHLRSAQLTANTLHVAAKLLENQARREEIVQNLFFQPDLSTIKP